MAEPDFLVVARQLAEEPLVYRFNTVKLTQALFLEAFATKWLVRLLSRGGDYPYIKPIPYEKSDVEDRIRYHFDPVLANAVLSPRPASTGPVFEIWLKFHTPSDVEWQDFGAFLILCDAAILRWRMRRSREVYVILGAQAIAVVLALIIQCLFFFTIYWRGVQILEIVIMLVAVLLAAIVCKNRVSIT